MLVTLPAASYLHGQPFMYIPTTYDIIILGAGALGSAAAYHAARRGQRVLLLEQYALDHQRGSSYGYSRIIRYVYDHAVYIGMAKPAYALWAELERAAGETLYIKTGGIDFGYPGGEAMFDGMIAAMMAAGVPHALLTPAEAQRQWPQFRFSDGMQILYQADTGILRASRCVRAHLQQAAIHGAIIRPQTQVTSIIPTADGVTVRTLDAAYSAARLIVTAGGWARPLLRTLDLDLPLRPTAAQENYFAPLGDPADFAPERFPCFIAHLPEYGFLPYGMAAVDGSGVKIGLHGGPDMQPDDPDRRPDMDAVRTAAAFAQTVIPGAAGDLMQARPCIYTMTPDEHFIIDHHPAYPQITIGACCSGHAFKFSGLIGSILTDLAIDGQTAHPIDLFSVRRFPRRFTDQPV